MDHSEATVIHAVEKYLLGELESSEKELFEEHFFTCTVCAAEVKAGVAFADNLRAVARDGVRHSFESPRVQTAAQPTSWGARLRDWIRPQVLIPSIAAAAFGVIAITQSTVTIPGLKSELAEYEGGQFVPEYALHAAARGEDDTITLPSSARLFKVYFDINLNGQQGGYLCDVVDAANRQRATISVPEQVSSKPIPLQLNARRLEPGQYTVVVRSASRPQEELRRFEFNLAKK